MDAEISPEPTAPERGAIAAALDVVVEPETADPSALYRSAWRLAGLRENAAEPPER